MDKRIVKSTKKLKEAYIDLLFKVEPDKIFVKDLCRFAGVNRSTFYDRYGYMDALVEEIIAEEIKKIALGDAQIDTLPKAANGIDKRVIRDYINRFYKSKILMRLCTIDSREKYVDIIVHKQVALGTSSLTEVSYYQAYFQCLGALATLIEWMNDPKDSTLDDIIDIVHSNSKSMFKH